MSAAKALNSGVTPQATPEARSVEPSMDDILASIRRIIADDQSRHTASAAPSMRPPAATSRPAPAPRSTPVMPPLPPRTMMPPRPSAPSVAISAPTLAVPSPTAVPPTPHINPPPLPPAAESNEALFEAIASVGVAAAMRPAGETALPEVDAPAAPRDIADEAPSPLAGEPIDVSETVATAVASVEAPRDHGMNGARAPVMQIREVIEPVPSPAIDLAMGAPAAAMPPRDPPGVVEMAPLVSPEAGATIGTSFSTLAASVVMQNNGLVESLARDMLRPMLKSWLDDNLPTIVERLVRIEIERVARGGRA